MQPNIQWITQRVNSMYLTLNSLGAGKINIYGTAFPLPMQTDIANGFVASNYSSNLLLSYAVSSASLFARTTDNYQRLFLAQIPSAVNATNSDTASWFAIVGANTAYCLIGTVSDTGGTSPMKLSTISIVSGSAYQIYSLGFVFHQ